MMHAVVMQLRSLAIMLGVFLALPWLIGGCVDSERVAEQRAASTDREMSQMPAEDEFAWLEETRGERALSWVRRQNSHTLERLTQDPRHRRLREAALAVARDDSRIPGMFPSVAWMHRGRVYSFWQDDAHPRGILRYTSLESFRTGSPDWQTLLDIDRLAREESRKWSFESAMRFAPGDTPRCLIALSDGGAGAAGTWREIDLDRSGPVSDSFVLPEAKSAFVSWKDADTLLVSTGYGANTVTPSGFPMIVKEWRRGEPLAKAREVFRAPASRQGDAAATMVWDLTDNTGRRIVGVGDDAMGSQRVWLFDSNGRLEPSMIPAYVWNQFVVHHGELLLIPQQDWQVAGRTWAAGSLLSVPIDEIVRSEPSVRLVFRPGPRESISSVRSTGAGLLVYGTANVRGRLWRVRFEKGRWSAREEMPLADNGSINDVMSDPTSPVAFTSYESVLHPPALYEVDVQHRRAVIRFAQRAQFASERYVTEQLEATSADGTRIPFFVTRRRDARSDGTQPTLLYGYGAFFGSQYPRYSGALGRLWLDEGGTYVLANIRGGMEFGPSWHVSGVERRHTYDDFVAVARELINRRITSPQHLGVYGVSAGGLLVGVMFTQHPQLFGAAIPKVPELDLLRPDLTYAGPAAAAQEFGSPEVPSERAFLQATSPYQNLHPRENDFPPFVITSTTDDQVHPSQARKFAAKMESLGMPFLFYETEEGGHAAASTPDARAMLDALEYTYLAQQLMRTE